MIEEDRATIDGKMEKESKIHNITTDTNYMILIIDMCAHELLTSI